MSEVKFYFRFETEGQKDRERLNAETICSDPLFRKQFAAWEQRVITHAWNSLIAKELGNEAANRYQAAVILHQGRMTHKQLLD